MIKCVSSTQQESDDGYPEFEQLIRTRINSATGPLLYTKAQDLFSVFLAYLPHTRQQHYNCGACRRFFEKYASIVRVDDFGSVTTLLWEPEGIPPFFRDAIGFVRRAVLGAEIAGVFLSGEATWGSSVTGSWTHLSGTPPTTFKHALLSADQAAAEKVEDYGMLVRALAEYPLHLVEQAVRILSEDALDRSEKTLGVAQWLLELQKHIHGLRGPKRLAIIWRAVATAPPGFAHVRSTMIGTLLDDLAEGRSFDETKSRWAAKMHPLKYQRPTVVKQGTIDRAERIVGELRSAGALERRFAKLSDVHGLWVPGRSADSQIPKGVFGHLREKSVTTPCPIVLPAKPVTWEKFARTVLPDARTLEVFVPAGKSSFFGLVTAANAAAPPILQWDSLERRNPVSWYFYHTGSFPTQWGMEAGAWAKVTKVAEMPPHWFEPEKFKHHPRQILLILEGCRDLSYTRGAAFFPEQLRNEYHEIRSVMEGYAKTAVIEGAAEGNANGIAINGNVVVKVRVTTNLGVATYDIDRLD